MKRIGHLKHIGNGVHQTATFRDIHLQPFLTRFRSKIPHFLSITSLQLHLDRYKCVVLRRIFVILD